MKYKLNKLSLELSGIVKEYIIIDDFNRIKDMYCLPDGGNFLFFNRGLKAYASLGTDERFEIPEHFSISIKNGKSKKIIIDKSFKIDDKMLPVILVELTPTGFYKLFNKNSSVLNNFYMPIDSNINEKYFNKLYEHNNIPDMINYLDKGLVDLKSYNKNTDFLLVEEVISSIKYKHNCEVSIEELILEFNISRKTLERQFKKIVGYTPKNYIFILKFYKSCLEYIQGKKTLKDIEYLYTDNSHFNVVFKNITGFTPRQLLKDIKNNNVQIYQMKRDL
jgi:AraC-like DNA-binding protein